MTLDVTEFRLIAFSDTVIHRRRIRAREAIENM